MLLKNERGRAKRLHAHFFIDSKNLGLTKGATRVCVSGVGRRQSWKVGAMEENRGAPGYGRSRGLGGAPGFEDFQAEIRKGVRVRNQAGETATGRRQV